MFLYNLTLNRPSGIQVYATEGLVQLHSPSFCYSGPGWQQLNMSQVQGTVRPVVKALLSYCVTTGSKVHAVYACKMYIYEHAKHHACHQHQAMKNAQSRWDRIAPLLQKMPCSRLVLIMRPPACDINRSKYLCRPLNLMKLRGLLHLHKADLASCTAGNTANS